MKPHRADCLQYICTCGNRSEIEILRDDLVEKFEMAVRLENMARDKEIKELKAENARYREALEKIVDRYFDIPENIKFKKEIKEGEHSLIAREALKGE